LDESMDKLTLRDHQARARIDELLAPAKTPSHIAAEAASRIHSKFGMHGKRGKKRKAD
jgi:hypothetical protein